MSQPEKLLSASRSLVKGDHQALRSHIPEVNHAFPELQIKWRRLGEAGLTLVERGQYQRVIEKPEGKLEKANVESLATTIGDMIIPKMPTEHEKLTPKVTGVDFMGNGRFVSIALMLEQEQLALEHERLTSLLDRMDGRSNYWGKFLPHVSIATIDKPNATDQVLEVFDTFRPENVSLLPVSVLPS